jgi:hypothetical protein
MRGDRVTEFTNGGASHEELCWQVACGRDSCLMRILGSSEIVAGRRQDQTPSDKRTGAFVWEAWREPVR